MSVLRFLLVAVALFACGPTSSASFGKGALPVSPTRIYAVKGFERGPEVLHVDSAGRVFRGDSFVARFQDDSILSPTGAVILSVNEDGSVTAPGKPVSELRFVEDDELRGNGMSLRMVSYKDEGKQRASRCQVVSNDKSAGIFTKTLDYRAEGFVIADARMDEILCLLFLLHDRPSAPAVTATPAAPPAAP